MRRSKTFQVLSTSRINLNGQQIPSDSFDWSHFERNPLLLYHRETEGHKGVAVGIVSDIRRVGDAWVGVLSFMENNLDADIAFEKYSQGVLKHVSVGGFAVGYKQDEIFVASEYIPREVSLVKFPANVDCAPFGGETLNASEKALVEKRTESGQIVQMFTAGCEVEITEVTASESTGDPELDRIIGIGSNRQELNASEEPSEEQERETEVEASEETQTEETEVEASEETQTEETEVESSTEVDDANVVEASAKPLPKGMEWHEQAKSNKTVMAKKTYKELNCDSEFQGRLEVTASALRSGAQTIDNTPDNVETLEVLASSMLADERMVAIAAATNVTDGVTKQRKNGLKMLMECAAGGAADATLAAADLGVIKYMGLFYEHLTANDTFRRSLRFVPMSDRTGAIYIEDGVDAPTYVGNGTPINAPKYTYDDIKRTIARRVFSFQPITFQNADLAVLAYDKQGHGIDTTMRKLMEDISTYWLQIIANTAGVQKAGTSGGTVSTSGLFPKEAPLSNINVKMPTLSDISDLESPFLMDNYNFAYNKLELVLPARIYGMLAKDPEVRNRLTMNLQAVNLASGITFDNVMITPRNPVARYNTTSGKAELDPSMYADFTVADDGTATAIVPAVTTDKHIGAGVAFIANEVLAGIGTIELISMPDPQNYGTTISGWVSTGATVARENGKGAALFIPTTV